MANITNVYLLNVPVESDYKITLYFPDMTAQYNYFYSKRVKSYSNFSYQRKEGIIRVPEYIDNLYNCNYVMYQNNNGKWYYAFIKDMEYKGDDQTNITIETDVMQTWMFDYTIKSAFIDRQHTNNDAVGANTLPENLETGEYIVNGYSADSSLKDYVYVLMVTEVKKDGEWKPAIHHNFGGIPHGFTGLVFATSELLATEVGLYDADGKGDAIIGAFMIPPRIIDWSASDGKFIKETKEPVKYDFEFLKPISLDGYTPKNKKLLCSPYQFLVLSNNAGSANILEFEQFTDKTFATFSIKGVTTIGGSIKCVPTNYKRISVNEEEGIMCGKFPTLSWSSDLYTNWLTQNALNIGIGTISSFATMVAGVGLTVASGGVGSAIGAGMITSGFSGVVGQLTQVYQQSFTPNSAKGNTNGGDINTASKQNTFHFISKSIKAEYAKIIDDYFTVYGYKTNSFGVPLKNHRSRFWFTKTTDIDINAPIPNNDIQKIKDCYNTGITFWRATDDAIGDYSKSNDIL